MKNNISELDETLYNELFYGLNGELYAKLNIKNFNWDLKNILHNELHMELCFELSDELDIELKNELNI